MSRPLAPSDKPVARPLTARPLLATPRTLDAGTQRVLRARLVLQRDFRIDQLAALGTIAPHPADSAQDEIVESLCRGAANALRETREALWRLDEGCFGRCLECTLPLELEQLAAVPQAARCPTCEFVRR